MRDPDAKLLLIWLVHGVVLVWLLVLVLVVLALDQAGCEVPYG